MEEFGEHVSRRPYRRREQIGRWSTSCIVTLLSQLSLVAVPLFSSTSSLLPNLFFSGVVLLIVAAIAKAFKHLLNLRASAPAVVFFNILFIWSVYLVVIRQEILPLRDIVFNGGLALLVFGFFRILFSDPGVVRCKDSNLDKLNDSSISGVTAHKEEFQPSSDSSCGNSSEGSSLSMRRVRYCRICKDYVRGFDHHCPAFGNCIGQKNHILFMALLLGFITVEGVYIMSSYEFARNSGIPRANRLEIITNETLAASTMLFCLLQVLWQVVFLAWHIYCICVNIKTDEWINWNTYPEFQIAGHSSSAMTFTNPYDKGILCNLKEFLSTQQH